MRMLTISVFIIILTIALTACGGGEVEIAGPTWQ